MLSGICLAPLRAQLFLGKHVNWGNNSAKPNFPLPAKRVGLIHDMIFEVRHRIGNLLGEPWEVSSARYDFESKARISISKVGQSEGGYTGVTEEFAVIKSYRGSRIKVSHFDSEVKDWQIQGLV